LKTNKKDS